MLKTLQQAETIFQKLTRANKTDTQNLSSTRPDRANQLDFRRLEWQSDSPWTSSLRLTKGSCVHLRTTRKRKSPRGPFAVRHGRDCSQLGSGARLQDAATLEQPQAGGRHSSLPDAIPGLAHTPTRAARSGAHTATASGDVPREVRASGTAVSAASSTGEPRAVYLGQPSAAPPPAPEQPPPAWTQLSDVSCAPVGRAQLRPHPAGLSGHLALP